MPSTRFSLREPATEQSPAHVRNVAQWSKLRTEERGASAPAWRRPWGEPVEQVRHDVVAGRFLDAPGAVAYGLVDEVSRPDADDQPSSRAGPPPMGFRPLH